MSFLNELRTKRHYLKPTTTTITYIDGRKYESGPELCVEVPKAEFGFIVDTKPDNVPAKILDFLYLGSQDCCELDVLEKFQINCVLSIGVEAPTKYENICYKFLSCLDLPEINLYNILIESNQFIENVIQKQNNILVHCNAGVSRSASIVIGYLILVCGYNYSDAYTIVKQARNCIRPNDGFVKQLKKLNGK